MDRMSTERLSIVSIGSRITPCMRNSIQGREEKASVQLVKHSLTYVIYRQSRFKHAYF
jgi:hypothetical protein